MLSVKRLCLAAMCAGPHLFGAPALAADVPRATQVGSTPAFVGAAGPSFTLYSFFDGVYLSSRFPGREYKAHVYQSTNGITVGITPNLSLGGGFAYSTSNNSLTYLGGRSETDGVTGFITAAFNVQNIFTVGASTGYGRFATEQVRPVGAALSLARPKTDSAFVTAYIEKSLTYGAFTVTPRARALWNTTETGSYLETLGILNAAETSRLGQFGMGATLSYAVPITSLTLYPFVEANFLYDFKRPLYQRDRTAVDLKAGLSASAENLSFGIAYVTIRGREEYRAYHGGRIFGTYRF